MTPLEIEILLHYYYTGGEDFPRRNAPAAQEAIARFLNLGLLEVASHPTGAQYHATKGVEVYVEALMAVPLPVRKWLIPVQPSQLQSLK